MPASVSLSLDQFRALAREPGVTVIPLFREILADVVTPVVAQATLGSAEGSFLLESVVGGEKWARYSFVGFDPQRIVRGVANRFETVVGSTVTREDGIDPLERLRETLAEYVPPREVEGLPRFWGGAVGYVTYHAARRFEPQRGLRFSTYARWWVRAHMSRAIEAARRVGWSSSAGTSATPLRSSVWRVSSSSRSADPWW